MSDDELWAAYERAGLFVCLSEHEGFGVPLVEAMLCELPVLAHPATAVPFTLGDAGLQIAPKDFPLMAEALGLLLGDAVALAGHVERGRRRAEELAPEAALDHLAATLASIGVTP